MAGLYSKEPRVGKAFVAVNHSWFRVNVYTKVDGNYYEYKTVDEFKKYEPAYSKVCEINDWQCFVNLDVYKSRNQRFINGYEYEDWMHIVLIDKLMIFYVWDTREIVKVANNPFKDAKQIDMFLFKTNADNHKALKLNGRMLSNSELHKLTVNYRTKKEQQ